MGDKVVPTGYGGDPLARITAKVRTTRLYISASKVMGQSSRQIMIRHVLPRARGPIIVQTSLFAAIALGVQTGLTYFGLGPPPPAPTWGGMVGEAASVVESFPYLLLPTGGIIALTVLALGILGDVIRDATADQHSAHGGLRAPKTVRPDTPAAPRPDVLLSFQGLTVTFETRNGPTTVIQDVSFDVPAGDRRRPGRRVGQRQDRHPPGRSWGCCLARGLSPRVGWISPAQTYRE